MPKPAGNSKAAARKQLPFHPWIHFLAFLLSITLLSFGHLPSAGKFMVAVVGIVIPFLIGLQGIFGSDGKLKKTPIPSGDSPPVPNWLLVLLFFGLFFTRLYKLTTLPFWPIPDEGTDGLLSVNLSRSWHWDFLLAEDRELPFFIWLGALFFKLFSPSFFSMRLLPAIVSIGTVLAFYGSASLFLSRWKAFLFTWILAFSFWEFTLSRFFMTVIIGPFFQAVCFGLLGFLWKAKGTGKEKKWIWALSMGVGLGFYTVPSWPAVWLSIALFLAVLFFNERDSRWFHWSVYLGVTAILVSPSVLARLSPGGMSHFKDNFDLYVIPHSIWAYTRGLFWDSRGSFPFGSDWGGFLNPILASLALIGFLHAGRVLPKAPFWCGFFSFLMGLAPGMLSNSLELYRVNHAVPWLFVSAVFGLQALWVRPTAAFPWTRLMLPLFLSFGVDSYNFIGRYCDVSYSPREQQWRSVAYFNAFQILEELNQRDGPLYIFPEFNTDYDDKTLNIACYPFDQLQNPALAGDSSKWAAFLSNIDYAPFLKKRFPGIQFSLLNPKLPPGDLHKSLAIFLVPTAQIPPLTLTRWIRAHAIYQAISFNVKNKNPLSSWEQYLSPLSPLRSLSKTDPFLASVFWEKTASFQIMAGDFPALVKTFQMELKEGYPAPHVKRNLNRAFRFQK